MRHKTVQQYPMSTAWTIVVEKFPTGRRPSPQRTSAEIYGYVFVLGTAASSATTYKTGQRSTRVSVRRCRFSIDKTARFIFPHIPSVATDLTWNGFVDQFLSFSSERLILKIGLLCWPNCGKMSIKVHFVMQLLLD